jgi:hypothetical protein
MLGSDGMLKLLHAARERMLNSDVSMNSRRKRKPVYGIG